MAKGEAPHYPQVAVIEATESYLVCRFESFEAESSGLESRRL